MLFAIESGDPRVPAGVHGRPENPRRWIHMVQEIGTTIVVFNAVVDRICANIEPNTILHTDDDRILLCGNLSSHPLAYVHQTIIGRPRNQFSIIPRSQYHPKIAL